MANGNYAYQPLAQFNPANLLNTRVAPVQLDPRNPGLEFNAAQTLQDFHGIRQGMRQDRALADVERLRQATVRAVGPGATQFDLADLEEYRQRFGAIPRDPITGQANMDEVRQRLSNQKQLEQAFSLQGAMMGGKGGLPGMGVAGMKPADQVEAAEKRQGLAAAMESAQKLATIIRDPNKNVVGPLVGRLGGLFQVGSALGVPGATQKLTDQRVVEQELMKEVLEAASKMKGVLSDKDIAFLKAAVPKLTDPEPVWEQFVNLRLRMTQQAMDQFDAVMGGAAPTPSVPDDVIKQALTRKGYSQEQIQQVLQGVDIVGDGTGAQPVGAGQQPRYVPDGQGGTLRVNPDGTAAPATDEELEAQAQQALQADTPMTPPVAAPVPGVNPQDPIPVQMLQRSVPAIPTNVGGVVTALGRTPITPVGNPAANYRLLRDLYRLATQPRPQAQPQIPVQPAPAPVIPRGQFRRSGRS